MGLFEECKYLLRADFSLVEHYDLDTVISLLHEFPFENGNILWGVVEYVDYKNIDELLRFNVFEDGGVFVLADDLDVPVFKTNINLIADNIYDVLALSPKLFIFNADVVMQSLFPGEAIRLSKKNGR